MALMFSRKRLCQENYQVNLHRQKDVYDAWMNEEESKEISGRTKSGPLITVVPYGKRRTWKQTYESIEYLDESADLFDFSAMHGEFIAYINGHGELSETALSTIVENLNHDLIYTDQDCLCPDEGRRHTPFFKPNWSPDTLSAFFYFEDFFVVRRSLAQRIKVDTDSDIKAELYEFVRQYTKWTNDIVHIPQILYHRCMREAEANKTDVIFTLGSLPEYVTETGHPLVSIIILSKDQFDVMRLCTESIEIKSKYNNFEILIVDNGSNEETKRKTEDYTQQKGYQYLYHPMEFNYSALCNLGAKQAHGEYLLFLNDDIEVDDALFIEKMLRYACLSHVGAVGAKLLYPNSDMIQHVGITSQDCGPSHKLATYSDTISYYFGRNRLNYDVLAVTGACMMISREKYFQVGGFSDKMGVSYNDVDLCVSLYEAGYYNVICNDTKLYHHESLARGKDQSDAKKYERMMSERACFYERHKWLISGDPFYNRNLIQDTLTYRPNLLFSHENRNDINTCSRIERDTLPKQCDDTAQWNLEHSEFTRRIQQDGADYYSFEGWALLLKKDNACYERYLLLIPPAGDVLKVTVSEKLREDVGNVFPDAKHSELAGFVCKVKADEIDTETIYQTAMLFQSEIGNKTYYIPGEQYEPKR